MVRQATELQTAKMVAAHYEKSYRWAMEEVDTLNNRQQRLLDLLKDYVERNVEQKRQIEALKEKRLPISGKALSLPMETRQKQR